MGQTWEVEQKFVVSDLAALQQSLQRAGLIAGEVQVHCDTYFRHPCRDFRQTDEALRVRQYNNSACVTYKGQRLDGPVKTRPEIELGVDADDFTAWVALLRQLGFEPLPPVRKTRRIYEASQQAASDALQSQANTPWQGVVVAVDEVEQLGTFAEVELLIASHDKLDAARQRVSELAAEIGLTEVQPQSYLSQLLSKLGHE